MSIGVEEIYGQIVSLNSKYPVDYRVSDGVELLDVLMDKLESTKPSPRYFELRKQFKQVIENELERNGKNEGENAKEVVKLNEMLDSIDEEIQMTPPPPPAPGVPPPPPPAPGVEQLPIASDCIENAKRIAETRSASEVSQTMKVIEQQIEKPNRGPEKE